MEGFEPSILRLGVLRPSRLGYKPKIIKKYCKIVFLKKVFVRADPPGFEPGVFGLEVRRPIQLGYGPLHITIINLFFVLYIFNELYKKIKKDIKNPYILSVIPVASFTPIPSTALPLASYMVKIQYPSLYLPFPA